jgi:hypothetical protein
MDSTTTANRELRDLIQLLAGTHRRDWINVVVAEVTAVDINTMSCSIQPISGDTTVYDGYQVTGVQLNAEQNDGFLLLPTVNSTVIVVYPTKTTPYVAMFSEIDAMMVVTDPGQQLLMGKYYSSSQSAVVDGEIQIIASSGEQALVGNPANNPDNGWTPNTGAWTPTSQNGGIQLNSGTSPAVLGDKNYTALTDVYNMLTLVQTFATSCMASTTDPTLAAAASTLNTSLLTMLPQFQADIHGTTSQKVSLD